MTRTVRLVRTSGLCILRQLRLEEALLRADAGSWCLVHDGVARPAAVLGLSGRAEAMLHAERVQAAGLAVARRFSGGGTVVVDQDTLFLMAWSELFYRGVFHDLPSFRLRENDYVLGEHKFGGNAQSLSKARWVHHTSFLWDYDPARMACLQLPARRPEYRQGREHGSFVCRLRDRWPSRSLLGERVAAQLAAAGYEVLETSLAEAEAALSRPHISGNSWVPFPVAAAHTTQSKEGA